MQQIVYDTAVNSPINPRVAIFLAMVDVMMAKIQHKLRHAWATVLEKKDHDEYVATGLGDADISFSDTGLTDCQTKVQVHSLKLRLTTRDSAGKLVDIEFNEDVLSDKTSAWPRIRVNFVVSESTGIISIEIA